MGSGKSLIIEVQGCWHCVAGRYGCQISIYRTFYRTFCRTFCRTFYRTAISVLFVVFARLVSLWLPRDAKYEKTKVNNILYRQY